jgi:hypothetical protein
MIIPLALPHSDAEQPDMRLLHPVIFVPTLFALSALAATNLAAAPAPSTFVIAASEGYGIGDCLAEGGSCGRIIADAWCVAHGATHALSFGPAADFAVASSRSAVHSSPGSLVISCDE